MKSDPGRVNLQRLQAATAADIAKWKREDGIDDASLGPARLMRAQPPAGATTDVRLLRERLGLSQEEFAERFQISLRTIQEWEQHRRSPEGPALTLLRVIERDPKAVERALAPPAA